MSELSFQEQAVLWGQTYEVFVKRGVLACLVERKILDPQHPGLEAWRETKVMKVRSRLVDALDVLDEQDREVIKAATEHMSFTAYGVGYTAMREYLKQLAKPLASGNLKLRALWCPLTLPGDATASEEVRRNALTQFHQEFQLSGIVDPVLLDKGMPANADFLLWLSGDHKDDYLLVQEYSFDMPSDLGDYREQDAHLNELVRHRRLVDSRSVFARVAAEVDGESFDLSDDIKNHLGALTGDNKPFYKLCQAAAYAEATVRVLRDAGGLRKRCMARALAITPNGLESLAAHFDPGGCKDTRRSLMEQMGEAYRQAKKLRDGDDAGLTASVEAVFNSVLRKLPSALQRGMKALRTLPKAGEDYRFEFEETLPQFANPMERYSIGDALAMVEETADLQDYFGGSAREAIGRSLRDLLSGRDKAPLRDLHAAAVVAGMERATQGRINVIALEGNPGIGKTTAVRRYLGKKKDGYLFLYVSPRVVINRDVTESLARDEGKPTGILTVTTNAQLIASAERWHLEQVKEGLDSKRHIDGAVVVDGVPGLVRPTGSVLVIDPDQEQEIEAAHAGSRLRTRTVSEYEDYVEDRHLTGVLAAISKTTQELLDLNPAVNQVVLTAALQGFRERSAGKTTVDGLSGLFRNPALKLKGIEERRQFARRIPNIVVMVDELAGDGAGAPFVHQIARWLESEFIDCFEDEPSPFAVTLVISDASLGNEVVLDRYLNAGNRSPDKVLISRSAGLCPFRVTATGVKVGGKERDTLHIMTNSYPASQLSIRYKANLTAVRVEEKDVGILETARQAIRRVADEALLESAVSEILQGLNSGAGQVIYFAQDKLFLSNLKARLAAEEALGLNRKNVQVLDNSVPGWLKKKLVEPSQRDATRVFLMTSSGSRGVSFPKATWIIAAVPRFNIEASLMEIAQLIYRGRGRYKDEHGNVVEGDDVPRQLVMVIEDFMVSEEAPDKRQWLRQSLDLMTLLVMLRSTIHTRITGDSGLRQSVALVPVGGVGVEELVSVMSQYVAQFLTETEIFQCRSQDKERIAIAKHAQSHVLELFSRTKLNGIPARNTDGWTLTTHSKMRQAVERTTAAIAPLLMGSYGDRSFADRAYFIGPAILEDWADFEKREIFSFEGHETKGTRSIRTLLGLLYEIDHDREYPEALRRPAKNLFELLSRDKSASANEFSTLKDLKSPNTWVAFPSGYVQFLHSAETQQGRPFQLIDSDSWLDGLAKSLAAGSAVMPPIPRYDSFPWAASVGEANPLKLDLVFDDRYFMASNELNLLNTLLLSKEASPS